MKLSISLAVLSLTFSVLAIAGESRTITYDGSQDSTQITLRGEKTHTEYTSEERPWTCYKDQIAGYETVCQSGPFPAGLPGDFPGGLHDPRYRYPIGMYPGYGTCRRVPFYRSMPYECTRTIRTGHEVKDYDVVANVTVDIAKKSNAAANENLTLTLIGEDVIVTNTSKKYLVVLSKKSANGAVSGSVKTVDAHLEIELVDATSVLNALELNDLSVEDGVLSVGIAAGAARDNIALSLNITKRRIGADKLILGRELAPSEVEVVATRDGTEARINISKLGVELNGKYALTVKASVKTRGALLNRASLPELEASKTLIYSIR